LTIRGKGTFHIQEVVQSNGFAITISDGYSTVPISRKEYNNGIHTAYKSKSLY